MAAYPNGDWHNANGRGIAFRPPTVDEALPYSPFTSVVPFSPGRLPAFTTHNTDMGLLPAEADIWTLRCHSLPLQRPADTPNDLDTRPADSWEKSCGHVE